MKKESIGKILLGKWDTRTIVGVAIGIALLLYGLWINYCIYKH